MAHFHAVLDYPDEDIDPFRESELEVVLSRQAAQLQALLATCRRGSQILHGLRCAIVGRPNAGKSSLLNALVGYDRAIVTDIPGTTRDTVEETVTVGGTLLRLIDTAGLRDTPDRVEQMGVERSRAAMESAELILVLWDSSSPVTQEDGELLSQAMSLAPTVLVRSKSDLLSAPLPLLSLDPMPPVVELSARTGQGLEELEQAIRSALPRQTGEEAYGGAAHQRPPGGGGLPGAGAAGGRPGWTVRRRHPDALLTDVEEALSALGGAHRRLRAGGHHRPDLPAFLRWKIRGARGPSGPRAETVEKGTSAFFDKRLHGVRDSISCEIVAPPAMRSVISEAHVLGNDGF